MMEELYIGSTPALLIGEKSDKVFLFVHVDLIVSDEVGHDFISQHQCQVTIMPDGEHWFHTPEQLAFLKAWEEKTIISNE